MPNQLILRPSSSSGLPSKIKALWLSRAYRMAGITWEKNHNFSSLLTGIFILCTSEKHSSSVERGGPSGYSYRLPGANRPLTKSLSSFRGDVGCLGCLRR